jgi:hypothetical protein
MKWSIHNCVERAAIPRRVEPGREEPVRTKDRGVRRSCQRIANSLPFFPETLSVDRSAVGHVTCRRTPTVFERVCATRCLPHNEPGLGDLQELYLLLTTSKPLCPNPRSRAGGNQ